MHKAAWDQRSTGLQQGQKQKETSKGTNLSTPLHYQGCFLLFLHLIIPLTLSKGLLFCGYNCNISGVLHKRSKGRLFLPFPLFHWSCRRTDGDFFEVSLWDLPMRPLKLHFRQLLPRLKCYRNNPHLSPCTEKGHTGRSSDDQNNLKLSFFRWLW